jgi:predicted ATPase
LAIARPASPEIGREPSAEELAEKLAMSLEKVRKALLAKWPVRVSASTTLTVKGRPLAVPRMARGVAWFAFADLCANPLAAADYLAIAKRFAAVIVEGIPRLSSQERNEARRFNILIDTL